MLRVVSSRVGRLSWESGSGEGGGGERAGVRKRLDF